MKPALADWTVNLEQPAGNVIMSANTSLDGKFAFSDLAAGEYVVSEVLKMGWTIVSPATASSQKILQI